MLVFGLSHCVLAIYKGISLIFSVTYILVTLRVQCSWMGKVRARVEGLDMKYCTLRELHTSISFWNAWTDQAYIRQHHAEALLYFTLFFNFLRIFPAGANSNFTKYLDQKSFRSRFHFLIYVQNVFTKFSNYWLKINSWKYSQRNKRQLLD